MAQVCGVQPLLSSYWQTAFTAIKNILICSATVWEVWRIYAPLHSDCCGSVCILPQFSWHFVCWFDLARHPNKIPEWRPNYRYHSCRSFKQTTVARSGSLTIQFSGYISTQFRKQRRKWERRGDNQEAPPDQTAVTTRAIVFAWKKWQVVNDQVILLSWFVQRLHFRSRWNRQCQL